MRSLLMIAVFILFTTNSAMATSYKPISIGKLSAMSELIVHGIVLSHDSRRNTERNFLYTFYQLEVLDVLKVGADVDLGNTIAVRFEGGSVGEISQISGGDILLQDRDQVILFLNAEDDFYVPTNFAQGVVPVVEGSLRPSASIEGLDSVPLTVGKEVIRSLAQPK